MEDSRSYTNVRTHNEKFTNVACLKKYSKCNSTNCPFYYNCVAPVRTFECEKNVKIATFIYNVLTGAGIAYFTRIVFLKNFGMLKFLGLMLFAIVIFDVIFTHLEEGIAKIMDFLFYKKLKRAEVKKRKLEEEKTKAEEAKKELEQREERVKNPHYNSVLEAENFVKTLQELADEYDFGEVETNVQECCKKLFEIVNYLKKDSSGYGRVAFLFEAYLPEFYNTLYGFANIYNIVKIPEKTTSTSAQEIN